MRSQMYPRNLFVYCSYWRKWSRVLQYMQPTTHLSTLVEQVQVDLEPINAVDWPKIGRVNIRRHCTARDAKDIYTADLPDNVVEVMRGHLWDKQIDVILHELLPKIDWDKYKVVARSGGGASFYDICK